MFHVYSLTIMEENYDKKTVDMSPMMYSLFIKKVKIYSKSLGKIIFDVISTAREIQQNTVI